MQAFLLKKRPMAYLFDESRDGCRVYQDAENKTEQCAIQMGIMINVVVRFFALIIGQTDE